jgi:hypothetical protein
MMESLSPTKTFIRVDFPTFGLPIIETNPALWVITLKKCKFGEQGKKFYLCTPKEKTKVSKNTVRGGAEVARWAHIPINRDSGLNPEKN